MQGLEEHSSMSISQLIPVKPGLQSQTYSEFRFLQIPLFSMQGLE